MVTHYSNDPWANTTTRQGYAADELISALQKSIRRGLLDDALLIAREMYETSPELEEVLWSRLSVISVEDAGDGSFLEPVIVNNLYEMHARLPRTGGDRWLFAVHAIRFLAERTKDRTSDELANLTVHRIESGEALAIHDWALDAHTRRGQDNGRTIADFWMDGAQVANERPGRDTRYLQEIKDLIEEGNWKA